MVDPKQDAPADDSIGADIAKSIASKGAQGVLGLAGMPGDVRRAVLDSLQWLHGHIVDNLGQSPEWAAEQKKGLQDVIDLEMDGKINGERVLNFSRAPSTAEIKDAVEKKAGTTFYKPQTSPGAVIGAGAEYIPLSLAGPGGLIPKIAGGFLTGAGPEAKRQYFPGDSVPAPPAPQNKTLAEILAARDQVDPKTQQ